MAATTRRAGPGSPDRVPHCRVVWDGAGEVGVWVANGDQPGWAWQQRVDVIETVADRAFEQARGKARGAGMALDAVEVLRDPRMIVPLTIAALVQVAAIHVGIPVMAAKLLGDAAGKLGRRFLAAEAGGGQDPVIRYADFDYDVGAERTRPESPEIKRADRASRHDAVGELLDARRDRPTRAVRQAPVARRAPAAPGTGRAALRAVQPVPPPHAGRPVARPVRPDAPQPADRDNLLRGVSPQRKRGSRGGRGGRGGLPGS